MASRALISSGVQARVLVQCRRRCCLCYYLDKHEGVVSGQIAHIDHDPANSSPSNLVFLCLEHHNTYDSRTSQSKNITATEVVTYRDKLVRELGDANIAATLISKLSDPERPLSSILPRVLAFARDIGDAELETVSRIYLAGSNTPTKGNIDDAPDHERCRSVRFYFGVGAELDEQAYRFGAIPTDNLLRLLSQDPVNWKLRYITFTDPMVQLEQKALDAANNELLTYTAPASSFLNGLPTGAATVVGYARGTALRDMIVQVRADLIKRLQRLVDC